MTNEKVEFPLISDLISMSYYLDSEKFMSLITFKTLYKAVETVDYSKSDDNFNANDRLQ